MQKILIILAILLFSTPAWALTYYAVASGDFNNNGTVWSLLDGGPATPAHPIAGDTANLTATSGAITVTIGSAAACAVVNCTGYTGSLVMNAEMTTTGNVTLPDGVGGTFTPNTQTWNMNTACTITSNGKSFYNMTWDGTVLFTLADDLHITNKLTIGASASKQPSTATSDVYVASLRFFGGSSQLIIGSSKTLIFNGTGTWDNNASTTANYVSGKIQINTTGTLTFGSSGKNACGLSGTLTYTAGTVNVTSGHNFYLYPSCSFVGTGTIHWQNIITGNTGTLTLDTDMLIDGNLTNTTGKLTFSGANVILGGNLVSNTATGIAGQTITMTGIQANATWSHGGSGPIASNLILAGNIIISGNVYYNTGTLIYQNGDINAAGSTINVSAASTFNVSGAILNNISKTGSSTLTLSSPLQLSGNYSNDANSILACGTNNVTIGGNWTNAKGTTGRTGNNTFIFTQGTHAIDGSSNWYNLELQSGCIFTMDDADVFTVTNNWNANGVPTTIRDAELRNCTIRSGEIIMNTDNPSTTVDFDVTGTVQTVRYVRATDIDSAGGDPISDLGGVIKNCVNWTGGTP